MTPELTADSPGEASKQIPSTAGMTTMVAKGTIWVLVGQVVPFAVSFLTLPFTIRILGEQAYGVFVLVGVIPAYFLFADFGMAVASTKFASEARSLGDAKREAQSVLTAAALAAMSSFPVAVSIFLFAPLLVGWFNVPSEHVSEAVTALRLAAVTYFIGIQAGIFNSPLMARMRMDLNTFITGGVRIVGSVAIPIVLYFGGGIVGATAVLLVVAAATLILQVIVGARLLNELKEASLNRGLFRSLSGFGSGMVLAGLANTLLSNGEKGILSFSAGVTELAFYSVAFTVAGILATFAGAMPATMLPAFSHLARAGLSRELGTLFNRGIRLIAIALIPAFAAFSLLSRPFFHYWAGAEFGANSAVPFNILLIGIAFNVLAYFPHSLLLATSRTRLLARIYWLELAPFMLLVWIFSSEFGAVGAATAWSLRVIADSIVLYFCAVRANGISFEFARIGVFFFVTVLVLAPVIANFFLQELNLFFIGWSFVSLVGYSVCAWKWFLTKEETSWLIDKIHAKFV